MEHVSAVLLPALILLLVMQEFANVVPLNVKQVSLANLLVLILLANVVQRQLVPQARLALMEHAFAALKRALIQPLVLPMCASAKIKSVKNLKYVMLRRDACVAIQSVSSLRPVWMEFANVVLSLVEKEVLVRLMHLARLFANVLAIKSVELINYV